MKRFYFILSLVLCLGIVFGFPKNVQAEEKEYRDVYVKATYKLSDTQVLFEFSEPIKINVKSPWVDIRMTNRRGSIVTQYNEKGERVDHYNWDATIRYFNEDHDKIVLTMTEEAFGCDSFSELLSGNSFPDDVKAKIENGTYRFMASMEELYLHEQKEILNDGFFKNFCAKSDEEIYVRPTRVEYGECVFAWLDELQELPSDLVVDESKYRKMDGVTQEWDFEIVTLAPHQDASGSENIPSENDARQVKNDPVVIALILSVGGLVGAGILVGCYIGNKRRRVKK